MEDELEFLKVFPRDGAGMMRVWELFSFDNLFRLLLKAGMDHEEAMTFMLAECDFSAVPWQERIHNKRYRRLRAEDALPPESAARRMQLLHDMLEAAKAGGEASRGSAVVRASPRPSRRCLRNGGE